MSVGVIHFFGWRRMPSGRRWRVTSDQVMPVRRRHRGNPTRTYQAVRRARIQDFLDSLEAP